VYSGSQGTDPNTGCVSESGGFATQLSPASATLGDGSRYRHSADSFKAFYLQRCRGLDHNVLFAVKAFFTNTVNSLVIAQREFRREFGIYRSRAVPSAHAIKDLGSKLRGYWLYNIDEMMGDIRQETC
jgi:hypothetical protein